MENLSKINILIFMVAAQLVLPLTIGFLLAFQQILLEEQMYNLIVLPFVFVPPLIIGYIYGMDRGRVTVKEYKAGNHKEFMRIALYVFFLALIIKFMSLVISGDIQAIAVNLEPQIEKNWVGVVGPLAVVLSLSAVKTYFMATLLPMMIGAWFVKAKRST